MRDFSGFEPVTGHNLSMLELQSEAAAFGNYENLQILIGHVVGLADMLPANIRKLVTTGHCYIGSSHWGKPDAWCHDQWRAIAKELAQGLDRVEVQREKLLSEPETTEREETAGEKILVACRQLRERGSDPAIARIIQMLAAGSEMVGDAVELERLFKLKRVRDVRAHDAEISRRITHIEIIAKSFHHR